MVEGVADVRGDAVGAEAVVIGSIGPHDGGRGLEYGYFVEWDSHPGWPVFVRGGKIGPLP